MERKLRYNRYLKMEINFLLNPFRNMASDSGQGSQGRYLKDKLSNQPECKLPALLPTGNLLKITGL